MLFLRMDYEQIYIDTLWKELEILPEEGTGDFRIDGNHLHIWPRKDFMFIAIPSPVCPTTKYISINKYTDNSVGQNFYLHVIHA